MREVELALFTFGVRSEIGNGLFAAGFGHTGWNQVSAFFSLNNGPGCGINRVK